MQPSSLHKFFFVNKSLYRRMVQSVMKRMVCASFVDRLRLLICTCCEGMLLLRLHAHPDPEWCNTQAVLTRLSLLSDGWQAVTNHSLCCSVLEQMTYAQRSLWRERAQTGKALFLYQWRLVQTVLSFMPAARCSLQQLGNIWARLYSVFSKLHLPLLVKLVRENTTMKNI